MLPVVQVHPTRRCNLRCLHCYSNSGPEQRGELALGLVEGFLADAAREGYAVASFSGGEPLLYSGLAAALDAARRAGLFTSLTTNGLLLDERRLASLAGRLDLLAVSVDGTPSSHDLMRAKTGAFDGLAKRLPAVRRSGLRFGVIFTLTQHNVHELDFVAQFALEQGACLLQIHPLEEVGRAQTSLPGARPDAVEAGVAYLELARLQQWVAGRMIVQLDLAHRDLLRAEPECVRPGGDGSTADSPLAELVNPLVLEADATVTPLQHGFPREYSLGRLGEATLPELAQRWKREVLPAFQAHCERVRERAVAESGIPVFNWYEAVCQKPGSAETRPGERPSL
jgi:Fe-coproporphyrin III synthase